MPIVTRQPTGQSLYARFDDASNTAVNLTEGTLLNLGRYVAADAAIDSAGLAAGTYSAGIFIGTAGAQANTDVLVGEVGEFRWDGTNEMLGASQASVDALPTASEFLTQAVAATNDPNTIGDCLNAARAQAVGKWVLDKTTRILTIYSADGTTPIETLQVGPTLTQPLTRTPQ